jgi:hypothetical protein
MKAITRSAAAESGTVTCVPPWLPLRRQGAVRRHRRSSKPKGAVTLPAAAGCPASRPHPQLIDREQAVGVLVLAHDGTQSAVPR